MKIFQKIKTCSIKTGTENNFLKKWHARLSLSYFHKYRISLNNVLPWIVSPPFSQNRGDIKYIKFEILQIVSPSEDVKFSNVRGLYLRKYCNLTQFISYFALCAFSSRNPKVWMYKPLTLGKVLTSHSLILNIKDPISESLEEPRRKHWR